MKTLENKMPFCALLGKKYVKKQIRHKISASEG